MIFGWVPEHVWLQPTWYRYKCLKSFLKMPCIASIFDIYDKFLSIYRSGKVKLPEWVDLVKTNVAKELAPYDEDW